MLFTNEIGLDLGSNQNACSANTFLHASSQMASGALTLVNSGHELFIKDSFVMKRHLDTDM